MFAKGYSNSFKKILKNIMCWSSSTRIIQVFLDNLGEKNLISLKFHAIYVSRKDYLDPSPNFIFGIYDSLIHNFPLFA